jgi:hypothetical protein
MKPLRGMSPLWPSPTAVAQAAEESKSSYSESLAHDFGESKSQAEGQVEHIRSCTVSVDKRDNQDQPNRQRFGQDFTRYRILNSPTIFSANAFFCS